MVSEKVEIIHNERLHGRFFRLGLKWATPAILPGQFVMLKVSGGMDPLLRRPFGIYDVIGAKGKAALRGRGIEILYQVVGKGTEILSGKRPGEGIDILGPVGNGFPGLEKGTKAVMVAGGMGIAPLYLFAKGIKGQKTLLFGSRTAAEARSVVRDFKSLDAKIRYATDDGSLGHKGFATGLLEKEDLEGATIYACGPAGMLKSAARIAAARGVTCYVSLERAMACGIGVCLGCAVKGKTEKEAENRNYKMVCSEGPVFDSGDIDWDAL